jgi:4-diphosphocytidyl-2-C-methyl-D-erythritol kinase
MAGQLKAGDCLPPDLVAYPAPAKLNLFLHVLGRRPDGYHLLQTVFRLIDKGDRVWLGLREDGRIVRLVDLPGVPEAEDLTVRAARVLQAHTGCRLGVDIRLEKNLPLGGGLGGGSSDAATVLLALNRLWALDLSRASLQELALQLGADVPFFVFGESAFAEGVGEKLAPVALPPAWYVVLTPPVSVATTRVFAAPELTRNTPPIKIPDFLAGAGHNDLEPVVASNYPDVARYLAWLGRHGNARMTGSGACVFLAVADEAQALSIIAALPRDMHGFVARGLDRHPLYGLAARQ